MKTARSRFDEPMADHRHDAEARRQFWIAFALAGMTSLGVAASVLALAAAGLALFA
jgi:hypothetical protein